MSQDGGSVWRCPHCANEYPVALFPRPVDDGPLCLAPGCRALTRVHGRYRMTRALRREEP